MHRQWREWVQAIYYLRSFDLKNTINHWRRSWLKFILNILRVKSTFLSFIILLWIIRFFSFLSNAFEDVNSFEKIVSLIIESDNWCRRHIFYKRWLIMTLHQRLKYIIYSKQCYCFIFLTTFFRRRSARIKAWKILYSKERT